MSTGSTHSFLSICRMRLSARDRQREDHEIDAGAARELDQVVDGAELRLPATCVGERSSPRSSNTPTMRTSESRCAASALISASPLVVAADDDGAAVEAALPRPAPHQQEQRAAEQRAARSGRRHRSCRARRARTGRRPWRRRTTPMAMQEHHRPGRGEAEVLLLVAAERLHLVDVGGLEREHRQHGDARRWRRSSARRSLRSAPHRRHRSAMPTSATSANSIRRTVPASTIGE